jgi:hypothetical protein
MGLEIMKYLKTYKIFETSHEEMMVHFGVNVIKECDSIIADIKDMVLELSDIGLFTMVGYTPLTLTWVDKTPKIMVEVQGDLELCESNEDDINSTFERIKDYVRSKGYPTGFGSWERHNGLSRGAGDERPYKVYQMLIQK